MHIVWKSTEVGKYSIAVRQSKSGRRTERCIQQLDDHVRGASTSAANAGKNGFFMVNVVNSGTVPTSTEISLLGAGFILRKRSTIATKRD